jgi:acetyl-CoA C-acetyltransferase
MKVTQIPVLAGVAQLLDRESDPGTAMSPLDMLERVTRGACEDAGLGVGLFSKIDTIGIVSSDDWKPHNAAALLAQRIGAKPSCMLRTVMHGGDTPLVIVNDVARRIEYGMTNIALVAGSRNLRTLKHAQMDRAALQWELGGEGQPELLGKERIPCHRREVDYNLYLPIQFYPLIENALRARLGLDLNAHRLKMGKLMHRFTQVAARNPYAWLPVERSADELTMPTATNRMIGFPYTKYLNAFQDLNQAAAVLMLSEKAAKQLGISQDRLCYWWGGAYAEEEPWFFSERPDLSESPSLRRCAEETFISTGTTIADIDFIDFYSCFPVAVELAAEAYGIDEMDPRGLTVTGGLPYAGGPGNNYSLHALAAMVDCVRMKTGAIGLVTGLGVYASRHSSTIISSKSRDMAHGNASARSKAAYKEVTPSIADEASGYGRIEAYTVMHNREGTPEMGIAIGRLEDGRRFLAETPSERSFLEDFVAVEEVGRFGYVRHINGRNIFNPN